MNIEQLINEGFTSHEIMCMLNLSKRQVYNQAEAISKNLRDKLAEQSHTSTHKNLINSSKYKRWYIENNEVISRIIKFINLGMGMYKIEKIEHVLLAQIQKIAVNNNLYDKLKSNNRKDQLERNDIIRKNRASKFIKIIENRWGDAIKNCINNGGILKDAESLVEQPYRRWVNEYIKYAGYHEKRAANSYKKRKEQSLKASRAGADKMRGTKYDRDEITPEMDAYFLELCSKYKDTYGCYAIADFHKKFRKSESLFPRLCIKHNINLKKHPDGFQTGVNNIMYGKEPTHGSGSGIKGHVIAFGEKIHFRSSLELLIFIYLIENNIKFCLSKHAIKFNHEGHNRCYFPDIVIGDVIYEIKPTVKLEWEDTKIKFAALKKYCVINKLKCDFITENTYDIYKYDMTHLQLYIDNGVIIINEKELKRLKGNIPWKKK